MVPAQPFGPFGRSRAWNYVAVHALHRRHYPESVVAEAVGTMTGDRIHMVKR